MGLTSASPENLNTFVTDSQSRRTTIETTRSSLAAFQATVLAGCQGYGVNSTVLGAMQSMLATYATNEQYVTTIHDQLQLMDTGGDGPVSVGDWRIANALRDAGLSNPPPVVTVMASEYFGLPPTSGFTNDPVCAANGNFVHGELDLDFPGIAAALGVHRFYNSLAAGTVGAFGPGWTSIADLRLTIVGPNEVHGHLADGAVVAFRRPRDEPARWRASGRRELGLEQTEHGWRLHHDTRVWWDFAADGRLEGGRAEAALLLARHADGRLVEVSEARTGRSVEFRWAGERIVEAVAGDGRSVQYRYDADGVLIGAAGAAGTVAYDLDGALILSLRDADGVRPFVNTYDATGRVATQLSPFGRLTSFRYQNRTTVLIDQVGVRNMMVHDERGNMTAVLDNDGRATRLDYDADNRVVRVTNRGGGVRRFTYDDRGNLVRRVDPDGLDEAYEWDDAGRLVAETDRAGNVTRFEYDTDWPAPTAMIRADGSVTRVTLDDRGAPVEVVDADGVVTRFQLNVDGQVTAVHDAAGGVTGFEYDAAGRLIRLTDAVGVITTLETDPAGRVLRTVKAESITEYAYTAAGRITSGVEAGGVPWSATFGEHGALASISDAAGSTVTFDYDINGYAAAIGGPGGEVYRQAYDPQGNLLTLELPSGATVEKRYDANGTAVEIVDERGGVWRRSVDLLGRTVESAAPDGATTRFAVDACGRIVQATTADGRVWRAEYDIYGRRTAIVDPKGRRAEIVFSPAGRVLERRSPAGRVERYEYDATGRCAAIVGADGSRVALTRDGRGRVVVLAPDGAAVPTTFAYDANGLLVAAASPTRSTTVERDSGGRVRRLVDATGVACGFAWDERGLLASAVDPAGGVSGYRRDVHGRVAGVTSPAGVEALVAYSGGWPSAVTDTSGATERYSRDPSGALLGIERSDGSGWRRELDPCGRELRRTALDGTPLAEFGYDLTGRMTSASVPGTGVMTTFMWDDDDTLIGTTDGDGRERRVVREADGLVTELLAGGTRAEFVRDASGAVTAIAVDGEITALERSAAEPPLDPAGRLMLAADGTAIRYDDAGRIAEVLRPGVDIATFEYDDAGLLAVERVGDRARRFDYDANHRLVAITDGAAGTATFSYDRAGRRIGEVWPDGTRFVYRWDPAGALGGIDRSDPDGTSRSVDIARDAFGRPAIIGGRPVVWDDLASGRVGALGTTQFVHAGHLTYDTATRRWRDGAIGNPWGDDDGNGVRLGAGNALALDRLILLGARAYDPATRQFLSPDPLLPVPGTNGGASQYTYAWNDPVNHVDPSGLQPISQAEWDEIERVERQGMWERAGEAIVNDPWGTLAMVGVAALGAVLCVTPLAPVGVGILVGVGVSGGMGLLTGTFNPRTVAVDGVIGGLTFGTTSAFTSAASSVVRKFGVEAAANAVGGTIQSAANQYITTGEINPALVAVDGAFSGLSSGFGATMARNTPTHPRTYLQGVGIRTATGVVEGAANSTTTQLVTTGTVDPTQVVVDGAIGGAADGLTQAGRDAWKRNTDWQSPYNTSSTPPPPAPQLPGPTVAPTPDLPLSPAAQRVVDRGVAGMNAVTDRGVAGMTAVLDR